MTLTKKIFLAMISGLIIGIAINLSKESSYHPFLEKYFVDGIFTILGSIFINLLKFMIVPIVFSTLIVGIANLTSIGQMAKLGMKVVILFFITTIISVTIAISFSYFFNIGKNYHGELNNLTTNVIHNPQSFSSVIINMVPSNFFMPLSTNNMLQIIVLSIILGFAIISIKDNESIIGTFKRIEEIAFKIVSLIMKFAPYGVFGLIAKIFAQQGYAVGIPILKYAFVLILGLLFLFFVVQPALILAAGLNPITFVKKSWSIMLVAFSTSSSGATLPFTIAVAKDKLGMSPSAAGFLLPFSGALNLNGTSVMLGCATIFIANIYNVPLSLADIIGIISLATLATLGTAGVPGAGMIMLTMILVQYNLPVEGIALILTVDRLLDMMRSAVTVMDDLALSVLIAKQEKELDVDMFNSK